MQGGVCDIAPGRWWGPRRSTRLLFALAAVPAAAWGAGHASPASAAPRASARTVVAGAPTGSSSTPSSRRAKHHKLKLQVAAIAAADPSETVSPDTGLTNGEKVSVTVSGFPANTLLAVIECAPGVTTQHSESYCYASEIDFIHTDSAGAGTLAGGYTVHTGQLGTIAGPSDTCAPVSDDCFLGASTITGSPNASVKLSFGTVTTTTTTTTTAPKSSTTTVAGTSSTTAGAVSGSSGANGSSSSGSAAGTGSGATSGSASGSNPSLANTGTPETLPIVAGAGLLSIAVGVGLALLPRRRRGLG